jgi:nicotinamidase-related amidase
VRNTCEDLLKAGFKVHLLKDCLAYVDLQGHDKAIEEMASTGITIE